MERICTNIEQSKKLLELGIGRKTSDLYYWCGSDLRIGGYKAQDEELDIPAWSLTALLELMPIINEYNFEYRPIIERYEDGGWSCKYYNEETRNINDIYIRRYGKTPLDAAFEMVCWLKENGKI